MSRLSLRLLGPFATKLNGQPLRGFRSDKVRALLAYLVVEAQRPWTRATLADLLWPNFPERTAESNLRNALSNLRHILGDRQAAHPLLLITPATIQFNSAADYWLDVQAFLGLLLKANQAVDLTGYPAAISRLEQALALYKGDFLDGFALDSAPFEAWLLTTREKLREHVQGVVRRLALGQAQLGNLPTAIAYTQRWLELEPWEEAAHRHLMQLLLWRGQRSAALVQYETCRQRLAQELGIEPDAETVRLYEAIRNDRLPLRASLPSAFNWPGLTGLRQQAEPTLFVARDQELKTLANALRLAAAGQGGVYFVTGEPGSGKTALLAEFARQAMAEIPQLLVVWGQCSAFTGQGDPYFPFVQIARTLTGAAENPGVAGETGRELAQRLWRCLPATVEALLDHAPDLIGQLLAGPTLLAFAQQHNDIRPDKQQRLAGLFSQAAAQMPRQRVQQVALFEQFTQFLRALAQHQPLLLIVDDMQWIDPGSVSLLFHLARQLATSHILLLGAYRSEEFALQQATESQPLLDVIGELQTIYGHVHVDLTQSAGMAFVNALLDSEPNRLPTEFRQLLYQRTSGNPLFTIELLRGMQLRGEIRRDRQGRWEEGPQLNWDEMPARVEAVIARRMAHLSPACQELLSMASVEGETFTAEVVATLVKQTSSQVCSLLSQEAGRQHRLVTAQTMRPIAGQNLALYRFRHGLFQIYLYNQLDVVEKARRHSLIAQKLEQLYAPSLTQFAEMTHVLARHFEAAGQVEKAVGYYTNAGKNALRLSANAEAIAHFYTALRLLHMLPPSPARDRQELDLQLSLGPPLTASKGWAPPEIATAYARAQELCANIDDSIQLIPALWLLATFRLGRSEHAEVDRLVARLYRLAQEADDSDLRALANLQVSPFYQGKFETARWLFERASTAPDVAQQRRLAQQYGMAPAVVGMAYLAECLWLLGLPKEADRCNRKAHDLAEQIQHPLTTCYVLARSCWLAAMRKNVIAVRDYAVALGQLARKYSFQNFEFAAQFFTRWADVQSSAASTEAVAQMGEIIERYRATGTLLNRTAFLVLLAQAHGRVGQTAEGLATVNESLLLAEQTGELWYQAEAFRVKGELLRLQAAEDTLPEEALAEAEKCLHLAYQLAESQAAQSLVQRLSISYQQPLARSVDLANTLLDG
jgi:predicted ATPase/DNA-binding SARP family transcriptional activator